MTMTPSQTLVLTFDEINALRGYIGHVTEDNPEKWFADISEEENEYWKRDATLSVYKKLLQRSNYIYMES